MPSIKPILLYKHVPGPNPSKVAIILEELDLPYESEWMDFSSVKQEPYISVNPNGRVPAIKDPNTGITLWESGAIIDYLIDTYDKEAKLHYTEFPQNYYQRTFEHFQMSGQGPYFGQLTWFKFFHPEKNLTSVIERYQNELKRVLGVIELHLTKTGNEYLVGDKVCYADLMFVPWNRAPAGVYPEFDWKATYPKSFEWNEKLVARPAVKSVFEKAEKVKAERH